MKLPERTFKPGDRVFTLNHGFQTVERTGTKSFRVGGSYCLENGFQYEGAIYRSIFTPEEAKELFGVEEAPPKQKVKRWRYYARCGLLDVPFKTTGYYKSETELKENLIKVDWCERIEESMREFEE